MRIAVLGGGAWGTTLADLAAAQDHQVRVWSRSGALALGEVLAQAEAVFSCLPMAAVAGVIDQVIALGLPAGVIVVNATKGLDRRTARPASSLWQARFADHPLVVLSGPNLAAEIRAGLPAATVVASADGQAAGRIQQCLASERFRVYTSADWRGVELGGVLKNVIAIAAGVSDGLGLGANAKAALITRGLAEMIRVGTHWGGLAETFYGLSGLGDLLTTCNSPLSRNYQVGFGLGKGQSLEAVLERLEGTAEGVATAAILAEYAQRSALEVPITDQICAVLGGLRPPTEALAALMTRRLREEDGG
ncbi:NAD(P)H-dependent glycerol-3-phosphate dehydrogenase [Gloeobacter violaceus]|uniref:Glycerol-3-phosphate dehydrogenase [NAD(P)+] n=1 Tax=Gloeobacter violaceus (strain ATCC 29082 / PCC 7421) TaxID=251221 RepID=GPDA_GLOVI|nr:NAD(P)H-dependent glycerol-3-phosphate dehydrogenase [Gloeobacter violaceus]Q7NF59.1 RecName: Full=Glycerol-3-phosphate dehydrogenase [NAD(P)+]; AltName: Full=NAD(P)H-dependent glycerol-3-phosphate dehydrogenase [Gloeobacter violaceus PCC 7421]BAC91608.1 NAD+ dependent glycerol-3-phosphate dehydrogenase [Gloeobacter violaceus PCC 7421]